MAKKTYTVIERCMFAGRFREPGEPVEMTDRQASEMLGTHIMLPDDAVAYFARQAVTDAPAPVFPPLDDGEAEAIGSLKGKKGR